MSPRSPGEPSESPPGSTADPEASPARCPRPSLPTGSPLRGTGRVLRANVDSSRPYFRSRARSGHELGQNIQGCARRARAIQHWSRPVRPWRRCGMGGSKRRVWDNDFLHFLFRGGDGAERYSKDRNPRAGKPPSELPVYSPPSHRHGGRDHPAEYGIPRADRPSGGKVATTAYRLRARRWRS